MVDAKLRWVAFYEELNGAALKLYALRAAPDLDHAKEKAATADIEALLERKAALDRETHARGLAPSPSCRDGQVVDLVFADPLSLRKKTAPSRMSATFRLM